MWLGPSDWSWLQLIWIVSFSGIGISGILSYFAPGVSTFLNDLVHYGKSRSTEISIFHQLIEVPKRWFTHFYIVAVCSTTIGLTLAISKYLCGSEMHMELREFIQYIASPYAKPSINEMAAILTSALLWLHAVRRLWESLFLSVYSDTRMNILHYLTGWMHYILVPVTLLAEAPGFASKFSHDLKWPSVTAMQAVAVVLFLWCSYHQHNCLAILARMRRNFKGNITNYAHGIPSGDWFDWVSCPHFLFEIGIYCALYLSTNLSHKHWLYVLIFVCTTQFVAGIITHRWYREKFKGLYPAQRKAVIPYLV